MNHDGNVKRLKGIKVSSVDPNMSGGFVFFFHSCNGNTMTDDSASVQDRCYILPPSKYSMAEVTSPPEASNALTFLLSSLNPISRSDAS